MKKVLMVLGLIFCTTSLAVAGDLKISGNIELQYLMSSDKYGDAPGSSQGDDAIKFEEIYIVIEKGLSDHVSAMVKLDGADMNEQKAHDHSMVEEAQIIFKNIANAPLTVYVGKDEMPWVQDYEKFLFGSYVHDWEIDKVLGFHGNYKIEGFGSVDLSFYERDTDNKPSSTKNAGLTDSMAVMLKANKLVKDLSLSAGYIKQGMDEGVETEDATGLSLAAKYKVAGFTVHAEMLSMEDSGSKWTSAHSKGSEIEISQVGVDYKAGIWLLKARYEIKDDDKGAGDDDTLTAFGVNCYVSDASYVTLEHQTEDPDGSSSESETMLGFVTKF